MVGFRVVHMLEVKVRDLNIVGEAIDRAVEAGVNKITSIMFTVSSEKLAVLENEAFKEAVEDARRKAGGYS